VAYTINLCINLKLEHMTRNGLISSDGGPAKKASWMVEKQGRPVSRTTLKNG